MFSVLRDQRNLSDLNEKKNFEASVVAIRETTRNVIRANLFLIRANLGVTPIFPDINGVVST